MINYKNENGEFCQYKALHGGPTEPKLIVGPETIAGSTPLSQVFVKLPVCEYLKGTKWDHIALSAISTLRPVALRVVEIDQMLADIGTNNAVTVYVDQNDIIQRVEMHVVVDVRFHINSGVQFLELISSKCPRLKSSELPVYKTWTQDAIDAELSRIHTEVRELDYARYDVRDEYDKDRIHLDGSFSLAQMQALTRLMENVQQGRKNEPDFDG